MGIVGFSDALICLYDLLLYPDGLDMILQLNCSTIIINRCWMYE